MAIGGDASPLNPDNSDMSVSSLLTAKGVEGRTLRPGSKAREEHDFPSDFLQLGKAVLQEPPLPLLLQVMPHQRFEPLRRILLLD